MQPPSFMPHVWSTEVYGSLLSDRSERGSTPLLTRHGKLWWQLVQFHSNFKHQHTIVRCVGGVCRCFVNLVTRQQTVC